MADVGGRNAGVVIDLLFERKDQQHAINRACDLLDALAAPGPDRRADEVNRAHALPAQLLLEPQVEVRCVDTDKDLRSRREYALAQIAPQAQQSRQVAKDFDVATHGKLANVMPCVEAGADHPVASDTGAVHVGCALQYLGNDGSRQ